MIHRHQEATCRMNRFPVFAPFKDAYLREQIVHKLELGLIELGAVDH